MRGRIFVGGKNQRLDVTNVRRFAVALFVDDDRRNTRAAVGRAVGVERPPAIEGCYAGEVMEDVSDRWRATAPLRFCRPPARQPRNEATLFGVALAQRLDQLSIGVGRFMAEPFVPVAANSLNGAAQKRPGAKPLGAPVPERPEPYEAKSAV